MTAYELAKQYYPRLWPLERIEALVQTGHLTQAQAQEILLGQDTPSGSS